MKMSFNKYWIIIVFIIIINIFIFMQLSKSLAGYLYEDLKIDQNIN